jgi:hypothetical protein
LGVVTRAPVQLVDPRPAGAESAIIISAIAKHGGHQERVTPMKNIQIIDGAQNCTYSLFAATNREFAALFPNDEDVAFPDEVFRRLGKRRAAQIFSAL